MSDDDGGVANVGNGNGTGVVFKFNSVTVAARSLVAATRAAAHQG